MNPFVTTLEEVDGIFLNPEDYRIPKDEEEVKYPTNELYQGDILGIAAESESRQNVQDRKKSQEQKAREYEKLKHLKECLRALNEVKVTVDGVEYEAFNTVWTKIVRKAFVSKIDNSDTDPVAKILSRNDNGVILECLQDIQAALKFYANLSLE